MKKELLKKSDIQKQLLMKLNKVKGASLFLTVVVVIGVILYPIHLVNYLSGTPFDYTGGFRSPDLSPAAVMIICPFLFAVLIIALLNLYYIDLYKIKKGKFEITEEELFQKEKETVSHNRNPAQKENFLYFGCGRVAVDSVVYSYARPGDRFYVVSLKSKFKSKRAPRLAYHTAYYEIEAR